MNVSIKSKDKFYGKIESFKKGGDKKIHILSDFDGTLTYAFANGVKIPSVISILRNEGYLGEDYAKKAKELFKKYHPIEISSRISQNEKKRYMHEWWARHNRLLIESGLSKEDLEKIANSSFVKFRKGIEKFLDCLYGKNIPLVIISASGCGEVIPMLFSKIGKNYLNIYYVINRFEWNAAGKAVSVKKPVIHSLNKDETALRQIQEIYKKVKERKNIILMGDKIEDTKMAEGFDYDNLLKIGFLNNNADALEKTYLENFDLVIKNDGSFEYVNNLIKEIM